MKDLASHLQRIIILAGEVIAHGYFQGESGFPW